MKKGTLTAYLSLALAAAAMAAAAAAPAEVIENLDFFSDFELISNLEILEREPAEKTEAAVSTAPAGVPVSSGTVKVSTVALEGL